MNLVSWISCLLYNLCSPRNAKAGSEAIRAPAHQHSRPALPSSLEAEGVKARVYPPAHSQRIRPTCRNSTLSLSDFPPESCTV